MFFLGGWKNVSVGVVRLDPLTFRYIHFNIWSHRLCSNVSKLSLGDEIICISIDLNVPLSRSAGEHF